MSDRRSSQESLSLELTCFGCGHADPDGFHLRTPLGPVVHLTAWPEHVDDAEIVVRSALLLDDRERATTTATWRRFRPR